MAKNIIFIVQSIAYNIAYYSKRIFVDFVCRFRCLVISMLMKKNSVFYEFQAVTWNWKDLSRLHWSFACLRFTHKKCGLRALLGISLAFPQSRPSKCSLGLTLTKRVRQSFDQRCYWTVCFVGRCNHILFECEWSMITRKSYGNVISWFGEKPNFVVTRRRHTERWCVCQAQMCQRRHTFQLRNDSTWMCSTSMC